MNNERGFFTLIGLCFLLAISICLQGIHGTEANYASGTANFQAETELQNAADGGLIEAAEKVRLNPTLVPKPVNYFGLRHERQHQVSVTQKNSKRLGKIEIKVLGERANIHTERGINSDADISAVDAEGIILMSVASCSLQSGTKKIYRRSLAYIADDKPEIICFMNDL